MSGYTPPSKRKFNDVMQEKREKEDFLSLQSRRRKSGGEKSRGKSVSKRERTTRTGVSLHLGMNNLRALFLVRGGAF